MNEMLAFPFMVAVIIGTALLSSLVTTALPYMPKYWHAFKTRIRRVFMRRATTPNSSLEKRVKELEEQVNNLAEVLSKRDRDRKSNIRRDVRDYLEELRTDKK